MEPSSVTAVLIVIVAVLPGCMYTWAFERQASAFGVTFADRTLRFVAISLLFHLALGWPEYGLYRFALTTDDFLVGQFAAAWLAALIVMLLPLTVGTVLGGLYASRISRDGWSRVRRLLTVDRENRMIKVALGRTPAPRAWDDLFSGRPSAYLRVRTVDGTWLAGRFADRSYAGGFPHDKDLLLEEAWQIDPADGVLGEEGLGYPVYISAEQIGWLEIVGETGEESADD
jgi:hypothetical protein